MGRFFQWCAVTGCMAICFGLSVSPTPTAAADASREGVNGLPADVTPLLSIAGIWQPIADKFIDQNTPSLNTGVIASTFAGNIVLPDGREGLAVTGWSYAGFSNTAATITPVTLALLEQQPDGTLSLATSKYVSDPETNGGANVLVADFNGDGLQDLFLPAHNESPFLPSSSTAYVSNPIGTFSKVTIGDQVEAHGAALASIRGIPTVYTASYYTTPPPNGRADTVTQYGRDGFTVVADIGTGGNSSVAVADFYGDGAYSLVCGDCKYGPGLPWDPRSATYNGIFLWNLAGLVVGGSPFPVGTPYFNGKPQYAAYPSEWDPIKTHNYRAWVDDFNHDGKKDIVVQEVIWSASAGTSKSMLQMFQNRGGYQFADVTDTLNPRYDQNSETADPVPQVRDVDASGINSWLSGSDSKSLTHPSANYVIVNDGSGALHVALHETLNNYARQVVTWLARHPILMASQYYVSPDLQPAVRAYRTADGRLNFVAIASVTKNVKPSLPLWVNQYIFVNIPLRLDIASQFTQALTVRDRNGSHLIRTFAGDDAIYAGHNGGYSTIDGGGGTNTLIYARPSQYYSADRNGDGTWTVADNVADHGTDTLTRIQRLQFADRIVALDTVTGLAARGIVDFAPRRVDLNGDGRGDVFSYSQTTGAWRWDLENGTLNPSDVRALVASTTGAWDPGWRVKAADFNGDGRADLFLYNSATGRWFKAINTAANSFTYYTDAVSGGYQVAIGNFGPAGGAVLDDAFFYNPATGTWAKCLSTGDGTAGFNCETGNWDPGWQVHPVDTDNDSLTDLFLYNPSSGVRLRALPATAGFTYATAGSWSADWGITPGAFDRTPGTDFLLYNATTGQWALIGGLTLNTLGSGTWSPNWTVKSGDLNGDGLVDVLLYNATTGVWFECFNTGAGGFTYSSGRWEPAWQIVVTNFDADARADLLLYNRATGVYVRCLTTGPGSFAYSSGNIGAGMTVVASRP